MTSVSSAAAFSQSYSIAMLGKVKEQTELEGRATLELLASATAPPPDGTGTLVDDVA